ncbi:MAG: hypothetical protein MUO40_14005 [Anaerolineaceae bacterium]|nr:hypothetical protein [Anaerolineaceae bacterium]
MMKRKRLKLRSGIRLVRIDSKTLIEVDESRSDEEAILAYAERLEHSRSNNYKSGNKRKHIKQ